VYLLQRVASPGTLERPWKFNGIVSSSALLALVLVAGFIPNICKTFEQQFSFPQRFKFTACGGITPALRFVV